MRVLRSLDELSGPLPRPVLTIGNFDGVHRGHQRILEKALREARLCRGTAVAMTFDPHPERVLAPEAASPLLTTLAQKLALLEAGGIELALVVPFTRQLSQLAPRQFIEEIVCRRLGTQVLCVGSNFRFGHRQAGDVRLLCELSGLLGFRLRVVPPVLVRGQTASSSLIRSLVEEGRVAEASRLLGRPFALTGQIQPGAGRGRPLGFPTLNLQPEQECLPARGVYTTETLVAGRAFRSATNVGLRPTFDGSALVVESHLLDFSETVASGRLEVRFHQRLREEKKFPSPEALQAQIARDVARTRLFFRRRRARRPTAAD